jgi:hypothetical protein
MTKQSIAINRLLYPYLTTVFIIWWLIIVDELFGVSVGLGLKPTIFERKRMEE